MLCARNVHMRLDLNVASCERAWSRREKAEVMVIVKGNTRKIEIIVQFWL